MDDGSPPQLLAPGVCEIAAQLKADELNTRRKSQERLGLAQVEDARKRVKAAASALAHTDPVDFDAAWDKSTRAKRLFDETKAACADRLAEIVGLQDSHRRSTLLARVKHAKTSELIALRRATAKEIAAAELAIGAARQACKAAKQAKLEAKQAKKEAKVAGHSLVQRCQQRWASREAALQEELAAGGVRAAVECVRRGAS